MFGLIRKIRRLFRLLLFLLIAALVFGLWQVVKEGKERKDTVSEQAAASGEQTDIRAMWLSQFDLSPMLTENGKPRAQADAERRLGEAMKNIASQGLNTVFVQVRPNGDSFYPSDLFPMSHYAVGSIGGTVSYDPLALILAAAKDQSLSVHAWINPLRLFTDERQSTLSDQYRHVAFCRDQTDRASLVGGTWYLNPAYAEVRQLITDGIRELLLAYPVDGIHIDDYFYPTTETSFDEQAYDAYLAGGGSLSLADFRRESVNSLIRECYAAVHEDGQNRVFGVSPSGNTDRNYHTLYADVAHWCREKGYIDYLCPQVYFGIEHETYGFEAVCKEFVAMTAKQEIPLYIGMTLGKAYDGFSGKEDPYAGSGRREWIEHQDVLARCYAITQTIEGCDGVAFFSYQYFFSPTDGASVRETKEERARLFPLSQ